MSKTDELTNEARAMRKPVSGIAGQGGSGAIAQLIQQYCPNGVEYKKLGEVCLMERGKGFSKSDISKEGNPIILYGELYTTYKDYITSVSSHTTKTIGTCVYANTGDLLLPISSTTKEAQIGRASVLCKDNVIVGGDAIILHHKQNPGYLMYLINSNWFEIEKMKCVSGTTIMHLSPTKLANLEIPVPPLVVQEEIVKILDRFAVYAAELQAELQARQQQYEYYRDQLLTFKRV
jgi:type I restriction enzyme S subunit